MSIKSQLREALPPSIEANISHIRDRYWLNKGAFARDRKRFIKSYFKTPESASLGGLEAKLIFHAHSIEKGLSHEKIRPGFGRSALTQLMRCLRAYEASSGEKDNLAYINAYSVLRAYVNLHKDINHPLDKSIFTDDLLKKITESTSDIGGTIEVSPRDDAQFSAFKNLFESRISVREFSDQPVDIDKIKNALNVSMKAPSICNRQTSRVRVISDKRLIDAALKIQNGMTGYEMPPTLVLVTADTQGYVGLNERNQPYVDGGLFAMSLLLSLDAAGLATCPLNTMFNNQRDTSTRKLLNIPDSEQFIMYIAVGNFKDSVKAPKSFRYPSNRVAQYM